MISYSLISFCGNSFFGVFYLLKFWVCHCFFKLLFIFWCLLIFINCRNGFFLPRPLLYIFLLPEFFLARLLLIIEIFYCPLVIPLSSPSFIIGISFLVQFFILLFSSSTTSFLLGSFLFGFFFFFLLGFLFFHWYLCCFFLSLAIFYGICCFSLLYGYIPHIFYNREKLFSKLLRYILWFLIYLIFKFIQYI